MEHSRHLPDWEEYKAMSREEKIALAKAIGAETGMDYKGIVRYSRWGMELETALYQKEGAEFVFLPGKRTELGWNGLPEQPEESGFLAALEQDILEYWGDRLPEPKELSWRENGFGLRIGYDHEGYRREVIRDCPWPFRGGDGGELACYGTLPALGPVVGSAHFLGWFGSSWDENRESIEMLLMDGLDGEYDFFRRILLLG